MSELSTRAKSFFPSIDWLVLMGGVLSLAVSVVGTVLIASEADPIPTQHSVVEATR